MERSERRISSLRAKVRFDFHLPVAECPLMTDCYPIGGTRTEAEAIDGGKNVVCGFGPAARFWIGIDGIDVIEDGCRDTLCRTVNVPAQLFFREHGEEALDLVDPRSRSWGVVDVPAGMPREPVASRLGLMGDEIVHDDMEIEILRHMRFDRVKEGTELACPMTGETAADDTTGRGVEVGKPREGSTALIVVGAPFGLA